MGEVVARWDIPTGCSPDDYPMKRVIMTRDDVAPGLYVAEARVGEDILRALFMHTGAAVVVHTDEEDFYVELVDRRTDARPRPRRVLRPQRVARRKAASRGGRAVDAVPPARGDPGDIYGAAGAGVRHVLAGHRLKHGLGGGGGGGVGTRRGSGMGIRG